MTLQNQARTANRSTRKSREENEIAPEQNAASKVYATKADLAKMKTEIIEQVGKQIERAADRSEENLTSRMVSKDDFYKAMDAIKERLHATETQAAIHRVYFYIIFALLIGQSLVPGWIGRLFALAFKTLQ